MDNNVMPLNAVTNMEEVHKPGLYAVTRLGIEPDPAKVSAEEITGYVEVVAASGAVQQTGFDNSGGVTFMRIKKHEDKEWKDVIPLRSKAKEYTVITSGGLNYPNMGVDAMARLVKLVMSDKRLGETVVFTITVQHEK